MDDAADERSLAAAGRASTIRLRYSVRTMSSTRALALAGLIAGAAGAAAADAPAPGRHCFAVAGDTLSGEVRLTVAADGRVSGAAAAAIHDDEAGYYTSYRQALTGVARGERLDLEVVTWIEEDRQIARETWTLREAGLDTGRTVFPAVDCAGRDDPLAAAEEIVERLDTAAGELTIGRQEPEPLAVWALRVGGELVRRFDARDEADDLAASPQPTVLRRFVSGVAPFDEVVVVQQHGGGNACDGGPLWLLGLRRDGSFSASPTIDVCGGREPRVERDGGRIRIEVPGGPPNRGEGWIPGETWLYEGGTLRRLAGGAAGATAVAEPPEPWATCRAAGTLDDPAPLPPEAAADLHNRVRQAFDLADDAPVAAWTVWRCMDGEVWACVVGANLPCGERADTSDVPAEPLRRFCREHPDSDSIPAAVTGRATVHLWRCADGRPEVAGTWSEPDARGFHREIWRRIDPPGP